MPPPGESGESISVADAQAMCNGGSDRCGQGVKWHHSDDEDKKICDRCYQFNYQQRLKNGRKRASVGPEDQKEDEDPQGNAPRPLKSPRLTLSPRTRLAELLAENASLKETVQSLKIRKRPTPAAPVQK
jgi:hypothetical protein